MTGRPRQSVAVSRRARLSAAATRARPSGPAQQARAGRVVEADRAREERGREGMGRLS